MLNARLRAATALPLGRAAATRFVVCAPAPFQTGCRRARRFSLRRQRNFRPTANDSGTRAPTAAAASVPVPGISNFGKTGAFGNLEGPFVPDEDSMDDYLQHATLSPWVPLPDVACRKLFDITNASSVDAHVDLGSGDGRLCFHAIDYGVGRSVGVDIDPAIVQLARDRLAKRHPPPNVTFQVADLLDEAHPVWNVVKEATIISMFFATEGLIQLRPILERHLAGRQCQIVCCGYEMPGWESQLSEVVLGTQLHLYQWGGMQHDDDLEQEIIVGEDILSGGASAPPSRDPLSHNRFAGSTVIDRTRQTRPLLARHDDAFVDEEEELDEWSSDDDEPDSAADESTQNSKQKQRSNRRPCTKS